MQNTFDIVKFFELGGFALYPLALCSLLLVKIVIERCFYLYKNRKNIDDYKLDGDFPKDNPYGRLLDTYKNAEKTDDVSLILEAQIAREEKNLTSGFYWLATISTISPFIGLLGTVLGIIKAFHNIAQTNKMGAAIVSAGVAEALITTAVGLTIAIISVVFYNYLKHYAENILDDLEIMSMRLLSSKKEGQNV